MSKQNAKTEALLDAALELLKLEGDFGLTMRKVAGRCEMSLSNVQYYFKNKDQLLKAMADRYFNRCLNELSEAPVIKTQAELVCFVEESLAHGHELSEMCRIFREYWAISTRNDVIAAYLADYYQQMAFAVADKLRPLAISEQALSQAVALFIPYVEGYSITGAIMPGDKEQHVQVFVSNLTTCLRGGA